MQPTQAQDFTQAGEVLAVSLELAVKGWKVGLHDGRREKPVVRRVASEVAGQRLAEAVKVMEETKKRWQLASRVDVTSRGTKPFSDQADQSRGRWRFGGHTP